MHARANLSTAVTIPPTETDSINAVAFLLFLSDQLNESR